MGRIRLIIASLSFLFFHFYSALFAQTVNVIVQSGNESDVAHIEFAPDGNRFLTLDINNIIKVWDTYTGIDYFTFQDKNIIGATFNQNGDLIVSTSEFYYDRNIGNFKITNVSTNEVEVDYEFDSLNVNVGFVGADRYLSLELNAQYRTPDGGTATPLIRYNYLYDMVHDDFNELDEEVFGVNISRDEKIMALRSGEEILIYDLPDMNYKNSIFCESYNSSVISNYISPDGKFFLTRYSDSIRIWNIEMGHKIQTIKCDWQFAPLAFSYNGNSLAIVDHKSYKDASTIRFIDISTGQTLNVIKSDKVESINFSPDGRYLISGGTNNSILLMDGHDGSLIRSIVVESEIITDIKFLNDNSTFVSVGEVTHSSVKPSYIKKWDLSTASLDESFKALESVISTIAVSPTKNKIVYGGNKYRKAKIYNYKTCKINTLKSSDVKGFTSIDISSDGELMASLDAYITNSISVWDLNKKRKKGDSFELFDEYSPNQKKFDLSNDGKKLALRGPNNISIIDPVTGIIHYTLQGGKFSYISFSPDDRFLGYINSDNKIILCDAKSGESIKSFSLFIENSDYRWNYSIFEFSANSKLIAFKNVDSDYVDVYDIETGERMAHFHEPGATDWLFSYDSKMITIFSQSEKWFKVYDLLTNNIISRIETNNLKHLTFTPDDQFILTYGEKSYLSLWDYNKGKKVVDIYSFYPDQFVSITADNYYSLSRNVNKSIAFQMENQIYPFDQFDLQFNRPDIVLERIGLADPKTIKMYRKAYYKRLKKMNIEERMFSPDFHVPKIEIEGKDDLLHTTTARLFSINVIALDSKYNINRINVWINDVAAFGLNGHDVSDQGSNSVKKIIELKLSSGKNKIQVSCLNQKGVESYKETIAITYQPKEKTKPNLYLVALSVSNYQQSEMNLKYAVKDGRDIANLYAQNINNTFANVYIDTLFNSNATLENVRAIKQKLLKSNVDDQVILYVSGHGLLDENLDFYFASHDMDFSNPALRGISYETLEDLLDSIPARKKLFMMDACHSGEVDKEDLIASNDGKKEEGEKSGVKTYSYKGARVLTSGDNTSKLGLQNSFELMQELFTNLNRGSGAVVISAAGGDSYALESKEWNNGVFTYAVINGLKNNAADKNKNGEVTVSELRSYVIEQVQELTNGRQKPTSRQENIEFDFRVW